MLALIGLFIIPGCFGIDSFVCNPNCVVAMANGTEHCNSTTGECLYGCQPGQAGPNCSFVCPPNCEFHAGNETETCNAINGQCLYGCQLGYAGPNCSVECPNLCASSNIRGTEICNTTTKACLFGCLDGNYGARCENNCDNAVKNCKKCSVQNDSRVICDECIHYFYRDNGKCIACNYWCNINGSSPLPSCRENDGYCNHGCKIGRYGFRCSQLCMTCKDECDRDIGHCLRGCKYAGYCGPTCELVCNDGCVSRDCELSCSCRLGCIRNKWGEQCEHFCNANCNEPPDLNSNICERSNGSCSYKCYNDTFWGSRCEEKCSSRCNGGICEQQTGNCTYGCDSKKVYGIGCDKACNENCVNGTCERSNGYCDSGCATEKYGVSCELKCNEQCNNHTCSRANGYCLAGCAEGWHGQRCDRECSDNCVSGICEQQRGYCVHGCEKGWYGDNCRKLCSNICLNFACKREDGDCTYGLIYGEGGNTSLISKLVAGLVSGWILSLVLFASLFVLLVRRYHLCRVCGETKKQQDEQTEMTEHEDRIQHEYMTLQHESGFSNQAACYETLEPHEGNEEKQVFKSTYENVEESTVKG